MAYLSIIIPVYNSKNVIENCLGAVRASTYQDYELIVVDDASTDDTSFFAGKYTENVIKLPIKKGRSYARNNAIKVAKGEIIVNIDSDIVIRPDTLNKIVDYFINHPEIDALTGCLAKEHPHENFFSQYKNLYMHYIFSKLPERVTFLYGSICAFRRKSVQPCYPDVEIAEDTELGQRLVSMGKMIAFLKDLQVEHLKKYNLFSFFKNDFQISFSWARIFLAYRGWKQIGKDKKGFAHASIGQLLSVICAPTIALGILISFTNHSYLFLTLSLFLAWSVLNTNFFIFMVREKGIVFGILSFLLTFFDHIVMASGIFFGFLFFLIERAGWQKSHI